MIKIAEEPSSFYAGRGVNPIVDLFERRCSEDPSIHDEDFQTPDMKACYERMHKAFREFMRPLEEAFYDELERQSKRREAEERREAQAERAQKEREKEELRANIEKRQPFPAQVSRGETAGQYIVIEGRGRRGSLTVVDVFQFLQSIDPEAKPSDVRQGIGAIIIETSNENIRQVLDAEINKSRISAMGRIKMPNRRAGVDLNHPQPAF